jgi:hypothetical protein
MKAILTAALLMLCATSAASQKLGIFADAAGTQCSLPVPFPGGAVNAYLVARTEGLEVPVSSVNFRIVGLPPGWSAVVTPAADMVFHFGEAFGDGMVFVFDCLPVVSPRVLATLEITPSSSMSSVPLSLEHRIGVPPSCSDEWACTEDCVRFCGCDTFGGPCYCAETTELIINGPCTTAISHVPWGALKQRYK